MRIFIRISFALIIIWFGVTAVRQSLIGYELGLFHELQYIPIVALSIFTVLAFILDTSYYKIDKKSYHYITSLMGVTFCSFVIIKNIQHKYIDNAVTVLKVTNMPGATNVITFQFKENQDFKLLEHNQLGQTIFYGKYEIINDSLFIRDNNYNGHFYTLPKTGIIKADTVFWTNFDTMLIDKN